MPTVRIVTGSYEHNLLCLALTYGEKGEVFTPIFHFTPHTQSIRSLAWSKKVLVSGANDELIRLYDLQHRRELGTLMQQSSAIVCLEFYNNKWLLSGAGDGSICLWRAKDWELLAELKAHKAAINDMSIHRSGKIMLSVAVDRKLVLWNLMTGRKASIRKLKDEPLQVSFCPGTESNYVIAYPKSVVLYSASGTAVRKWEVASRIHKSQWYNDLFIVSTEEGKLVSYDLGNEEPAFELQGHATRVKDLAILGDLAVSISSDGSIVVWDLLKRDQLAVYNAESRLNCVALIPDEVEKELKRPQPEAIDAEAESDFSEVDEASTVKTPKKKKNKQARVVISRE